MAAMTMSTIEMKVVDMDPSMQETAKKVILLFVNLIYYVVVYY